MFDDKKTENFVLWMLTSIDKPVYLDPPDYQKLGYLVDNSLRKKGKDLDLQFGCRLDGPHSNKLEEAVGSLSSYSPFTLIQIGIEKKKFWDNKKMHVISRYKDYFQIYIPLSGELLPLNPLFPLNVVFWAKDAVDVAEEKITGKRKLKDCFLANFEDKEKKLKTDIGEEGLQIIDNSTKKYSAFPRKELYTRAREEFFAEHPEEKTSYENMGGSKKEEVIVST